MTAPLETLNVLERQTWPSAIADQVRYAKLLDDTYLAVHDANEGTKQQKCNHRERLLQTLHKTLDALRLLGCETGVLMMVHTRKPSMHVHATARMRAYLADSTVQMMRRHYFATPAHLAPITADDGDVIDADVDLVTL